ncbi:MAG: sigma 54-interacting transcriptional regulator [Oscillospiraceae bacterium]|nr:sigma 54-interacting transcriptional regulator [Oscillospiraceae bacterium]
MGKPYKICFLVYMKLGEMVRKVISDFHYEDTEVIEIECNFINLPQAVEKGLAEGCEVFVAGSANAAEFRNRAYRHLIEIRIDIADYLLSIRKAIDIGGKSIAIATYHYSPTPDLDLLRKLSPCPIELIRYEDSAELYSLLKESSCDTVIGASFSYEAAESLGKKGVLIYESEYTIRSSIEQARRLAAELRVAAREREITNTILQNSPAGIIVTDEKGVITVFSNAAKKMIPSLEDNPRGRMLDSIIPALSAASFPKNQFQQERRILLNGAMLRCVRSILMRGEEPIGTLYTLFPDNTRRKKDNAGEPALHRPKGRWEDAIGESEAMKEFLKKIRPLSNSDYPLMIFGEPGTGKRFIAQCVHNGSSRAEKPYILLNMATVPASEAARILFGSEDAGGVRTGVFEQAAQGTIVLVGVSQAFAPVTACLLHVLTEHCYYRVGGNTPVPFMARVITLTSFEEQKNIPDELLARLSVFSVSLPPLQERKDDILLFFRFFLLQENIRGQRITEEMEEILKTYSWPENLVTLSAVSKRYAHNLSQTVKPTASIRRLMLIQAIGEDELLNDLQKRYPALSDIFNSPLEETIEGLKAVKRLLRYNNKMIEERFSISRSTIWRMQKKMEEEKYRTNERNMEDETKRKPVD